MTVKQAVLETTTEDPAEGPLVAMSNLREAAADTYDSVQFAVRGTSGIYQFKIRCLPETGFCILVREDSNVLPNLKEGAVLDMAYCQAWPAIAIDEFKTRITSIGSDDKGRFKGHQVVGLSILSAHP
ncbi:MAG: hypothetical protein JEZ11_04155 [Desulfobacterales bacterium]|nr:hypothetical protein [Desulfobacterales bacterium]